MKYQGSCHCGKVRFEIDAKIEKVLSCNCSICLRRGSMLTFVPEDQFKLLSGETALTDYQFGKKRIHHLFCATCGVSGFGKGTRPDGTPIRAINVRCLENFDLDKAPVQFFDGKSL